MRNAYGWSSRFGYVFWSLVACGLLSAGVFPWMPRSVVAANQGAGSLDLEIVLDKETFLVGEPIWVDVRLCNAGGDTIVMPHQELCIYCGTLRFFVTTDGDTLPYRGSVATVVAIPRVVPPGKEFTRSFDLREYYGASVVETLYLEKLIAIGTYEVSARDSGVASRNRLGFSVVEPSGHDANTRAALEAAYSDYGNRKFEEAADELRTLVPDASAGPYGELIHFLLAKFSRWAGKGHIAACQLGVEQTPNSRYAEYFVRPILERMGEDEARAFASQLEHTAPSSRAAKLARRLVE
jgi:hypothetical protein